MSTNIGKWASTAALLVAGAFFAPPLRGGDLSGYRGFQLGMDLNAAAKQGEAKASEAKTVHQRPVILQDLEWRPRGVPATSGESDPVKDVLLSFYNGQLFRIVANYDRYRTEGMTRQDMIDAISVTYGVAASPTAEILFPGLYAEMVKVIARWEDSGYSVNLVESPYQSSFALISFSKQLDTLAQAASVEAKRLDAQEAPQREAELKQRQADEASVNQEKARTVNKSSFRL